jgi:diguanylate cyclase (GGDEF)-like protein
VTGVARWMGLGQWRLSTRMVVSSLLLLLLVQLAGFAAIRAAFMANAQSQLNNDLALSGRIWQRLLDQRATKLSQGAAVLAADFGFREAVGTSDVPTIVSALDNHGARIQATAAALLDTELAVHALSDTSHASLGLVLKRVSLDLTRNGYTIAAVDGRPHQFVMVPMRAPRLVGWVMMGFALDAPLLDDMLAISGHHATLVTEPMFGAPRPLLTNLPGVRTDNEVAVGPAEGEIMLGGATHRVHSVPVTADSEQRVSIRFTGSLERAIGRYQSLQVTLVVLTTLGLVLFGFASVLTARRVTRPLIDLAKASEHLGGGCYNAPLLHIDRADEVGDLARALDHMRVNIAAKQSEIRQLAYWDRLTGLPNREQFRDAVMGAIHTADPAHDSIAVLMLDLDRFKNVNDTLGYACGDSLLRGVTGRLRDAVRPNDLVARLGGDEFAVLMPHTELSEALAVAARVIHSFEASLSLEDQAVDLSAGIGIAFWPEHASDADALLSRAEVAMYAAKSRTAGAQIYDPAVDTTSAMNLSLLGQLRHALEHQELRMYLQPKIELTSGDATGAEALVRWHHPQRGLVPPAQFIPFAEQSGFVRRLTLWIFEEAARYQHAMRRLGVRSIVVDRRFWNRLFLACLSETLAGRRIENRQEFRHGDGARIRRCDHCALNHRSRAQSWPHSCCRGSGESSDLQSTVQSALRRSAGLLHEQAPPGCGF